MYQIVDLKLETETLNEMKQKFEEDKRVITTARKDINAITTLLGKLKQLPIISEFATVGEFASMPTTSVAAIQDEQLAKLLKEIHNYNTVIEDLTVEINHYDEQLETKRRYDTQKEVSIKLYNKIYNEVENLRNRREVKKHQLKTKQDEMAFLAKNIKLSTLDTDFIEDRLEARSKLFNEYMESNQTADEAIRKIAAELGKHIQDIKELCNEFISYETNVNPDPEYVHELLNKIQEKEDVMDLAADLLKKYDQENANLKQLFDAIRLNNMSNIFELLIVNFQKMVADMSSCKEEMDDARLILIQIDNHIEMKNEQLEVMLKDIMDFMKMKPVTYPTNGNNKDLLAYFTNVYKVKKENQMLSALVKKIKDRGTEVIHICRDIINYQEKENQKLSVEISAKTDVVNRLQERYSSLHQEVQVNVEAVVLQSKLMNVMEENEHLRLMNECLKSQDEKLSDDVKVAGERINYLEIENAELYESNTELVQSNTELRNRLYKMEKYVEMVRVNLKHLQYDEDDDSDDSFAF